MSVSVLGGWGGVGVPGGENKNVGRRAVNVYCHGKMGLTAARLAPLSRGIDRFWTYASVL